jgi:hypothetical protein
MHETVRPRAIFDAANYLIAQPLYQKYNIVIDLNWLNNHPAEQENFIVDNNDLPNDLNQIGNFNNLDSNVLEDEPTEDERYAQIQETLLDQSEVLSFAPGENRRPIPLVYDKDGEELAFPTIYGGHERSSVGSTYTVTINSELKRYDRRAARVDHLLYCYKKHQIFAINSNISIALRQKVISSNAAPTAAGLLDPSNLNDLINHDSGYRILKNIRSSPAYWEGEKRNVCAMIRQLGMPTLFITLSAAEAHWPELMKILKLTVDKEETTDENIAELTTREKYRLIQADPVTCALYFNHRFRALLKTWKSNNGPFGSYKVSKTYCFDLYTQNIFFFNVFFKFFYFELKLDLKLHVSINFFTLNYTIIYNFEP